MPIYEYECGSCGRRFETLQRFSDDPLTTDPDCGGDVRRVIQPVGIIFKGSGFYVTDSRKSGSASTPGSSESGKSDTKSESKSESSSSDSKSSSESKSSSDSKSNSDSKSSSDSKGGSSSSDSKATAAA
jgi:putative FmdB family regulatory protein